MRTALTLCASALMASAFAVTSVGQEYGNDPAEAVQDANTATEIRLTAGREIHNQAGEEIGTFEGVVIRGGETQLIISVGEFLGLGGRHVLISPSDLSPNIEVDGYSVPYTEEELQQMDPYEMAEEG